MSKKDRRNMKIDFREICETEDEYKNIMNLPEIERERIFDEKLQKYFVFK